MVSQEISKERYFSLSNEIGRHNEIQSALKDAYELIKGVKEEKEKSKNNPTRYIELEKLQNKFIKEYIDLEIEIKKAITDDNKISEKERTRIMLELGDMIKIADESSIVEDKNKASKIGDWFKGTNTKKVKDTVIELTKKDVEKYSKEEAKAALEYLNKNYITGKWNKQSSFGNSVSIFNNNINDLDDLGEVNIFQEKLLKKIYGENFNGYNQSGEIHAYHKNLGNYITNAPIVEKALKTNEVKELGNKALKNYLSYLESKGELNAEYLIKNFGKEKAKLILKFVDDNKTNADITGAGFLSKIGGIIENIKQIVLEKVMGIFNNLTRSSSINDFKSKLEDIKKLDKDEQQMLIEEFDKEIKNKESALRKLFIEPIKAKLIKDGKTEKDATIEAENITNEILIKIDSNLSPEKLGNAYKIIEDFNKEYNTKLSPKKAVGDAVSIAKTKSEVLTVKSTILAEAARKNGDEEKAKQYEKDAHTSMIRSKVLTTTGKLIDQTSEQEARDIGTGKLDYEKHLKNIYERNPSLKKEVEEINQEKQEFEDQNKKTEDTNKISKTETESKQTNIETSNYTYDENSGVIEIALDNGNQKLELSPTERELAKNNPEAIKNIVDFFKILNELGLSELWKEKEKIFTSISNKNGIGFNAKSGYLSENETKVFLNSILKSVGQEKIDQTKSLTEFKNIFSNKNDLQIIGSGYKDNLLQKGSSKISEQFLKKYILGKPYFDVEEFSKNI
ncbi:MAG: hypothetical protein PHV23_06035 [Candidatus Gracilibacteria bacterium]|nr:hypothetical protein [Candidatus Gracilibacteria bacterium]